MEQRPSDGGNERDKAPRGQRFIFGPWVFNVDRGLAITAESLREVESLPVVPWAHFYGLDTSGEDQGVPLFAPRNLDRDYAMTTDLDEPVLVATLRSSLSRRFPLLIDGTHRLYKAYVQGVEILPAYMLDVDESLAVREDGFISSPVHWQSHDPSRLLRPSGEPGDTGE